MGHVVVMEERKKNYIGYEKVEGIVYTRQDPRL
jgi:hypothetical protein